MSNNDFLSKFRNQIESVGRDGIIGLMKSSKIQANQTKIEKETPRPITIKTKEKTKDQLMKEKQFAEEKMKKIPIIKQSQTPNKQNKKKINENGNKTPEKKYLKTNQYQKTSPAYTYNTSPTVITKRGNGIKKSTSFNEKQIDKEVNQLLQNLNTKKKNKKHQLTLAPKVRTYKIENKKEILNTKNETPKLNPSLSVKLPKLNTSYSPRENLSSTNKTDKPKKKIKTAQNAKIVKASDFSLQIQKNQLHNELLNKINKEKRLLAEISNKTKKAYKIQGIKEGKEYFDDSLNKENSKFENFLNKKGKKLKLGIQSYRDDFIFQNNTLPLEEINEEDEYKKSKEFHDFIGMIQDSAYSYDEKEDKNKIIDIPFTQQTYQKLQEEENLAHEMKFLFIQRENYKNKIPNTSSFY